MPSSRSFSLLWPRRGHSYTSTQLSDSYEDDDAEEEEEEEEEEEVDEKGESEGESEHLTADRDRGAKENGTKENGATDKVENGNSSSSSLNPIIATKNMLASLRIGLGSSKPNNSNTANNNNNNNNNNNEEKKKINDLEGTENQNNTASSSPWARVMGSKTSEAKVRLRLLEDKMGSRVRDAQIGIAHSIKHAGWTLENKVTEVSRRGWGDVSRMLSTGSTSGGAGGRLPLPGSSSTSSFGAHERSSLLTGPGDGYQRLDNRADGWGDDGWGNEWNSSTPASPTGSASLSPKNSEMKTKKSQQTSSLKKKNPKQQQQEELLVDLDGSGTNNGTGSGHTWDNWEEDWEKVDSK